MPVTGLGPIVSALDELPARPVDGVVLANELLDNLAFEIVVSGPTGAGTRCASASPTTGRSSSCVVPAAEDLLAWRLGPRATPPPGTRLPVATDAVAWIAAAAARAAPRCAAARRLHRHLATSWRSAPAAGCAPMRGHARGGDAARPRRARQDITADVPVEMLHRAAERRVRRSRTETAQAEWLRGLGIDELVAEGARRVGGRGHAARPRGARRPQPGPEAAALTDPTGLGAHTVLRLVKR